MSVQSLANARLDLIEVKTPEEEEVRGELVPAS
jgi:hypothetical protein